jgi:proteasome lid subunit RPN8/RPN11
MFDGLLSSAQRWLGDFNRSLFRERLPPAEPAEPPAASRSYQRLRRVVLTDEVSRTLFQEYATHRAGARGEEEIGWVLLGVRENDHALALATLPAGARRQAGVAHVQFNASAQAVASCILRQTEKRLTMLGVVHTHPGSLRHPSDGDFQGDSQWVARLRGKEGIFGIGTADGRLFPGPAVAHQPKPHMQTLGDEVLSWYALAEDDRRYRPLEVQLTLGPDLALPLHGMWTTMEWFAAPLERLYRQQAGLTFQLVPGQYGAALGVRVKLAEPEQSLRVVLEGKEATYYLERGEELLAVEAPASELDRAVYLVLAELTEQRE